MKGYTVVDEHGWTWFAKRGDPHYPLFQRVHRVFEEWRKSGESVPLLPRDLILHQDDEELRMRYRERIVEAFRSMSATPSTGLLTALEATR